MYNDDETWSSLATYTNLSGSTAATRLFDGNLETQVNSDINTLLTVSFGQTFNDKPYKLEVYTSKRTITVNGQTFGVKDSGGKGWIDCGQQQFTSFEIGDITGNATSWATAVRIDGKILADPVNESQVWSDGATVAYLRSDFPIAASFNGDPSTYGISGAGANSNIEVIFNPPIDVTSKVEVAGGSGTGDTGYVTIDGVDQSEVNFPTNASSNPPTYTTMFTGSGLLSKLYIKDDVNPNNANQCGFNGIKVDGVLLVDKGTNLYGDTKLIKETPYNTKLTVASPTDLADMTGPTIMTDGTESGPYTQTPYKLVDY